MARRLCGVDAYPGPLLAVAGYGLAGADRPWPGGPLDDDSWSGLLAAARKHRVLGPLRAAAGAGALPATAAQADAARAAHRGVLLRVLSLERELMAVADRLEESDVDFRVLKGSAYAHLDYPDPALRSFIDLDVLVRADDIGRAVAALSAAGFARTLAEPRPGFDRRFDKGTTLRHPGGFEVDLHRTFVLGPWGVRVDLDSLWDDGEEFAVGGRTLRALSRTNRLLHACYHAALGDWPLRLGSLRDVAALLPRTGGEATEVRGRAAAWGVEAVVAAAVADARRLLGIRGGDAFTAWADGYLPTRREEAWLGLHTHEGKTFAAQALATIPALPGFRDRVAYLRALLLPDRGYTEGRHPSALSRFRFAVREIRRGRGAPARE
ncbi:putative nucleotidyltransferase-like protein [Prauserella shujinwangii]|uniref:Putative nucleotidyltransferase-like protein n=1 Tax=Prauserella shujinwangii TaxID=1453103 RepID=A0A2T0LQN6_9PSEU|nr:nucleotidyltransferase family protein [Prauserella shujinwangii]PRX45631.1 putative nucleotidyltransferase-like protein [Prauserella shujinwangii]